MIQHASGPTDEIHAEDLSAVVGLFQTYSDIYSWRKTGCLYMSRWAPLSDATVIQQDYDAKLSQHVLPESGQGRWAHEFEDFNLVQTNTAPSETSSSQTARFVAGSPSFW